jgi:thioredoxin 1
MSDAATIHLTEQNFDEALTQHPGILMVDFWAEWCAPCKAFAPVLEDLARDSAGMVTLAKVNVDDNPGLAGRYGIRSIPTVLFVKEGKVVDQVIGNMPKSKVKEKLNALAG